MKATVIFLPNASSPLSVELPSARIVLPATTLSPTWTIGLWCEQILELASSKLATLYVSFPSFVLTTIVLIVGIIYSRASLGKINLEVQELSGIIKNESEDNQSLVMKINEMVSLDNIQVVSKSLGLTYNNENIKSVTE